VARSRRQWGSVRSLASGRYQARYFDPDTRGIVPAPQDLCNQGRGGLMAGCKTDRARRGDCR
jgi:hypothetical protein